MEIERSETELLSRIVYLSEHKKSAGSFHSATFWVDWKRVRQFTGWISGPKDCGSKKIEIPANTGSFEKTGRANPQKFK